MGEKPVKVHFFYKKIQKSCKISLTFSSESCIICVYPQGWV